MEKLTDSRRQKLRDHIANFEAAPYRYYTPNGACEDIIRAIGTSKKTGKKIFTFAAANGIGKTTLEFALLGVLMFGEDAIPPGLKNWFDYPLFKQRWTLPKVIWVVTEDSTLRETWDSDIKGLHYWLPQGRYTTSKDDKGRLSSLKSDTGWQVYFKTVDQNPRKFESTTVGIVIYDEPVSHAVHKGCAARLRKGGLLICAATPLEFGEWMIDSWIENEEVKPYFYIRYACVYENMKKDDWDVHKDVILKKAKEYGMSDLNPKRGILSKEDIDFMKSQYDEEEELARVWGQFKALKGNVYKTYKDEPPFVIEPFDVRDGSRFQIYNVLDPHDRRYPAIGWYAIDKTGQYYIIHEYPNIEEFQGKYFYQIGDSNLNISDISDKIKSIEKAKGWNVVGRYIDPNFGLKRYGNTGNTVQEEYEIRDLYFDAEVTDDLDVGHSKVRELLKVGNLGVPGIQVFSHCHNHRWAFRRYRYDNPNKGSLQQEKILQSEKVVEKAKDFADTTRYFAVNDLKFSFTKAKLTGWRSKLKARSQSVGSFMGS